MQGKTFINNFISCLLIHTYLMRNCPLLIKKTKNVGRYPFVFILLVTHFVTSAQLRPISGDSLFKKNADTTLRLFDPLKPYYIIRWEGTRPGNIPVIRQLDDKTAIIAVTGTTLLKLIKAKARIA